MKKQLGAKILVYPTPVFIVASYDASGKANAMNVAWGGVCCSSPKCVSVAIRPATYTHGCILEQKAFTVNIPCSDLIKQADYFGMASGKNEDKFKKTGLTAVKAQSVNAPVIEEFPVNIECSLLKDITVGSHTLFIGEIKNVQADENVLDEDGIPDIEKIKPFIYDTGKRTYQGVGPFLGGAFSLGKGI